ncbi:MAG: cob(I)yrinic acid a,c-diamide adenosyltransferase [Prolixibacteraceae bacterium]|jgi:cob(I)alamin adenosyltransferase|nr:cob(I)yrinic acid a,c-diamide adenosyltransferase [Prolixibacteraceae bacterium]
MNNEFKIYTKTGDNGTSGLIGGTRVEKTDQRLEAYGTVDELNSWIGILKTSFIEDEVSQTLELIQNKLFVIGSYLATDSAKSDLREKLDCTGDDIIKLENEIDRMQEKLPALTHFVLPGGTTSAAQTHVARTVCRRAERRITAIDHELGEENNILKFINRLSDYLFVMARYDNFKNKQNETLWKGNNG